MTTVIYRARDYAMRAHAGQKRKYTLAPYITHCGKEKELYIYRTDNGGIACTYDKSIYKEQKRKHPL